MVSTRWTALRRGAFHTHSEPDDPDRLYESRLYTPFRAGAGAAGLGSSRCGGKPSCRAGDTHAFGCTREDIRRTALVVILLAGSCGTYIAPESLRAMLGMLRGTLRHAARHDARIHALIALAVCRCQH